MGHYVYKYVLNDEIIYIGKCDSILNNRISQHGKLGDNISPDAWKDINKSDIYYITLANSVMSDVVESELIRRYTPKYNVAKKTKWSGLPFVEPEWEKYERKSNNSKKQVNVELRTMRIERAYMHNRKPMRLLPYIINALLNKEYELSRLNIRDYDSQNQVRSDCFILIKVPDDSVSDNSIIKYVPTNNDNYNWINLVYDKILKKTNGGLESYYLLDINNGIDTIINGFKMLRESIYQYCELKYIEFPQTYIDMIYNNILKLHNLWSTIEPI